MVPRSVLLDAPALCTNHDLIILTVRQNMDILIILILKTFLSYSDFELQVQLQYDRRPLCLSYRPFGFPWVKFWLFAFTPPVSITDRGQKPTVLRLAILLVSSPLLSLALLRMLESTHFIKKQVFTAGLIITYSVLFPTRQILRRYFYRLLLVFLTLLWLSGWL